MGAVVCVALLGMETYHRWEGAQWVIMYLAIVIILGVGEMVYKKLHLKKKMGDEQSATLNWSADVE